MINEIKIDLEDLLYVFDQYNVTDDDITKYSKMFDDGHENEALDLFIEEYMIKPSAVYQKKITDFLEYSFTGPLSESDENKLTRNVALLSTSLALLLSKNFKRYMNDIHSVFMFKSAGLNSQKVRTTILKAVLADYEQSISGAMSQTQAYIISGIRKLQREMIAENVLIKKSKITGELLTQEIKNFKNSLKDKFPDLYDSMKEGKILISRKYGPDGESVRHYKLDTYVDGATRSILLNVDRNTVEIMARVNGERVVNYYQADPRSVKKDRDICQEILSNNVQGKSLLAIDDEAARILGIMTIDEAKNTPDYAMGPGCRHTFKRCDVQFLKIIDKLLGAA